MENSLAGENLFIDMDISKSNSILQNVFNYCSVIFHASVLAFVVFIFYLSFVNELLLFTWHPLLLTTGWLLLMFEGVLAISTSKIFGIRLSYKQKVTCHWILQSMALSCTIAGFLVVYINKNIHNKSHFTTWHGLLGLISIILCILSCSAGALALFNYDLKKFIQPAVNKLIHYFIGVLTFFTGCLTILLGIYSSWYEKKANKATQFLWLLVICTTVCLTLARPLYNIFNRYRSILRSI